MRTRPCVLAALSALVLFSCRTLDRTAGTKSFDSVDYTSHDIAATECARIERLLALGETTKALWRSVLLEDAVGSTPETAAVRSSCEEAVAAEYEAAVSGGAWQDAVRLRHSLESCSYGNLGSLSLSKEQLLSNSLRDVPGLGGAARQTGAKVSSFIKGTVTVYVDKGIKVQHGMGYQDAVLGSGFFISSDGYIVTNHHVIADVVDPAYEGYARLYIRLSDDPDTRIPAKVVGWDPVLDLALLKSEVDAPYVFTLGSSSDLDVGDRVYAIGSPLGLDRTLTSGIISAVDRRLFTEGVVFQIDAAVNSGNSGGPLIDGEGRVQAIVFASVENYQGLNFAIPVEYLRTELPLLFAGGERIHPWICAYGKTDRLPGAFSRNEGVLVQYVMPGGSASLASVRADDVIVSVDGTPVTSLDDLQNQFMRLMSGTVVRLGVRHPDGTTGSVPVYLSERPEKPGYEIYQTDLLEHSLLPLLGMELLHASSSNRKVYSVAKILKASSADESGFSEGDYVQILGLDFDSPKTFIYVTVYTKRRKNGWLDMSLALAAQLDSPYYF